MALLGLDTATKKGIFLGYMGLWSALRLLIYGSKRNVPEYNQTTLLVFVCLMKIAIAGVMYLQHDGVSDLVKQTKENWPVFLKYFFPALSYVVYDNLTFVNLSLADPVTYVILMQMRLAATGLMWSLTVGRKLNRNQWMAIGLLTIACMLQKGGKVFLESGTNMSFAASPATVLSLTLIGLQILCGVFSSVFNEVLLKEKGSAGVDLQNLFMYVHSLALNLAWLSLCPRSLCKQNLFESMQLEELQRMIHPLVLPIMIILASIGIVTSLFIKHLDSVRKTIASAIEIFIDALLSSLIFGLRLGPETVLATIFAAGGVILYSRPCRKDGEGDPGNGEVESSTRSAKIFSMSELLTGRKG